MTNDEREVLIKKAAKALYRANWGDEFTFDEDREYWVNQARAAFAVFEAAQKPTGDEREALIMALVHTVEYVGTDMLPAAEGWSWYDALAKYAPERLNGFRRPASPAPSADEEPRGAGPWLRD